MGSLFVYAQICANKARIRERKPHSLPSVCSLNGHERGRVKCSSKTPLRSSGPTVEGLERLLALSPAPM